MVRLADLEDLPRPGSGGFPTLQAFRESPAMQPLDSWPMDVVEQFLFEHGAKSEFIEQYGHLDLDRLRWTLEQLPASEFAQVTWTLKSLGGRVVECERAPGLHL